MNTSKNELVLEIRYNNEKREKKFKDFKSLDDFTSCFESKKELAKLFFKEVKSNPEILRIRYTYKDKKNNKYITVIPPLKLANDNFDEMDLRKKFISFLYQNPECQYQEYWQIIYIIKNSRNKNNKKGDITSEELEYAVNYMFNKSYKAKRDIYYKLKKVGVKIKINKINDFPFTGFKSKNRIQDFEMKDDYQLYLQSYSLNGEDEYEKAMEEISLYDLDKLPNKNIANSGEKLFDGTTYVETSEKTSVKRRCKK